MTLDPNTARKHAKANSMQAAWDARFPTTPLPRAGLVMLLAHGESETLLGDSWPGEHNVGACQERVLNAEEKACLASAHVVAGFKNVDAAKVALDAAGLRSAGLHCDSSPVHGPYFVFFRVFDDDQAGDDFFILQVTRRAACKVEILRPNTSAYAYAAGLYASGYFEGFHDPKKLYVRIAGKWVECEASAAGAVTGREANIQDYCGNIARIGAAWTAGLVGWTYTPPTLPTQINGPPTLPSVANSCEPDNGVSVAPPICVDPDESVG